MEQVERFSHFSTRFRYVRLTFLFVLASGSLILAVAEPQFELKREESIYKKINVVFLLDTSLSMRARDIAPSRIDRAREEIQNFILHRNENIGQIGLINFAGSSVILSYLTEDAQNIVFYLDYLEADLRPEDFTFILISDGEDHGESLQEAVQKAIQLHVRTYTVGLGTETGVFIPIGERDGHTVFLVDEEGDRYPHGNSRRLPYTIGSSSPGLPH